jgi:hypothetical protein
MSVNIIMLLYVSIVAPMESIFNHTSILFCDILKAEWKRYYSLYWRDVDDDGGNVIVTGVCSL